MDPVPIEFAFPGPLRDRLVGLILAGTKTTTTGLLAMHVAEDEPLPTVGLRQSVVDSNGRAVGVIETMSVDIERLNDVPLVHVLDEGEGHKSIEQWSTRAILAFRRGSKYIDRQQVHGRRRYRGGARAVSADLPVSGGYIGVLRAEGALRAFVPALLGRLSFATVTLVLLLTIQRETGSSIAS